MRIKIETEKFNKNIYIPSFLIFNNISMYILNKKSDEKLNLSFTQINKLKKSMKISRKILKGKPIIEVYTKKAEHITIFL